MKREKVTEVVERYLTSKNEDYQKDYEAVKAFMRAVENNNKNNELFNDLEMRELKMKIATNYLYLLRTYRQIPKNNTPTANPKEWKKGFAMLIQMEKSTTPEDREYYLREFETILYNCNLDTMVMLLSIKEDSDRRMKMLSSLDGSSGGEKEIVEEEIGYITSALAKLQQCTTVDEIAGMYKVLACDVVNQLVDDLNMATKRERELAFGNFSSAYRNMLVMLEKQEDKNYNVNAPKYCLNQQLQSQLLDYFLHSGEGYNKEEAMTMLGELGEAIDYRYKVSRTVMNTYHRMCEDYKVILHLVAGDAPISTVVAAICKLKW